MNATDVGLMQFDRLVPFRGVESTISRGDVTVSPTIVLCWVDSQSISSREAIFVSGMQDVLVRKSDITDLGEPEEGDGFTYVENGETVTAEARPPDQNSPCFIRWNGNGVYRVHCKVVSRVAVG